MDKKKLDKAMAGVLREVTDETKEIWDMTRRGIPGIHRKIKNPEWEENGNNGHVKEYVPAPSFYQNETVQLEEMENRLLSADDMGLGKTLQAIASKVHTENKTGKRQKTLVVVPGRDLKNVWKERIGEYCEPDRIGNVVVIEDYKDASIKKLKNADWAITNYEALSFDDSKSGRKGKLKKMLKMAGFNIVILDESHNVKNPGVDAYRSQHVRDLVEEADRLLLLSGTPLPDNLQDSYMMIALLTSKKGKPVSVKEVRESYKKDPALVRAVLRRHSIRRKIGEVHKMPPLKNDDDSYKTVELNPEHKAIYQSVYDNCQLEGSYKLQQLRKALLDPSLVNPDVVDENLRPLLDTAKSSKYEKLDEIIREKVSRGSKVVVYSPEFQNGVTENLEERYAKYGAVRMDGTNAKEREDNRKRFQDDPEVKVLVATDVAGEGLNLTKADTVVFLYDDYSPGGRKQKIGRVWRPGQKKPVEVINLHVAGTIDEGVKKLLEKKQEAIDFVVDKGRELSKEQRALLDKKRGVEYLPPLKPYMYSPEQEAHIYVHKMSCQMAGKGERKIRGSKWFNGGGGKRYAEKYTVGWNESYSANVARLTKQTVDAIEEKEGKLKRKVDLASGFGVLSKVTGDETVNIDLIRDHFKTKMASKKNDNIEGSIIRTPIKDGSADLVTCSLALHDTSNKNDERSKTLVEANRILRNGGYYIVTLPRTYVAEDTKLLNGFREHGFEPVQELSGFAKSVEPANVNMQTYVVVARKVSEPKKNRDYSKLHLTADDPINKGERRPRYGQRNRKVVTDFAFFDPASGKEYSLKERLNAYLSKS